MLLSELPIDDVKIRMKVQSNITKVIGEITHIHDGRDGPDLHIEWQNGNATRIFLNQANMITVV